MISRYSDHAANERTYLAWVRTAIAVMAFGFLVEKFDLFLEIGARSFGRSSVGWQAPSATNALVGDLAGLLLIVLGGAMIGVATARFRRVGRDIDAEEARPARGTAMDIALVALLLGLGTVLFGYMLFTLGRRVA